jgi:Ca2+:H+ antiporter
VKWSACFIDHPWAASSWRWWAARPRWVRHFPARKNRLDLSVGIALGSASQIALFVVLVLVSYFIGPTPMDPQFWLGAVVMILIATLTATFVTNSGRSTWFVGALVLMVYLIFTMTPYLLPARGQ